MAASLALVVALSVAAGGTAGAQEDLVTLTVSVETPGGTLLGGATVTASWDGGSRSRTTASNGKAFVDVPDGEDVELTIESGSYVRNFPVTVDGASAREVTLTVFPRASAEITVTDGDGPVQDANVRLRKDRRDVVASTTDDGGVVESGTIESGDYTVVVSKSGYYVTEEEVDIRGDTELEVSIERGTVTLEVNVTDDHFDPPRPVGEATVDIRGSGSVVTQPGGIGRISVPVNAWATLEVTKEGYETTGVSEFVAEEDKRVDVSIQRTPAISTDLLNRRVVIGESTSLSVTDEYGDPVAEATVRVDGEAVAETDEAGQAVIQVESAGNHTVVVRTGSLEAEPRTVVGVSEAEAAGTATEAEVGEEPEPTTASEETDADLPGFGVEVALLALALAVGLAARSRRR